MIISCRGYSKHLALERLIKSANMSNEPQEQVITGKGEKEQFLDLNMGNTKT